MGEKVPTYNEFKEAVRKCFFALNGEQNTKQSEEYFKGSEAKELIDSGYKDNLSEFKKGEINRLQFLSDSGGVGAVAYNLYMLC